MLGFRFRLAGTKICEQFGRELRGSDFLGLWAPEERDAAATLVRNVLTDAAVGHGTFRAYTSSDRQANFEFVLMPLIHTGKTINRLLGAITAIEPPFWLGAEPLLHQEIVELKLHWPDGVPVLARGSGAEIIRLAPRRFRLLEGGLTEGN
jgi:hypothetical protein